MEDDWNDYDYPELPYECEECGFACAFPTTCINCGKQTTIVE